MKKLLIYPLKALVFTVEWFRKWLAIQDANMQHMLDGKRYWVLKLQGKYRVYNNQDIKRGRKAKIFQKDLDFLKLKEFSVYHTK